jgi:hypothetical protein
MSLTIIGFAGPKGVGKDTTADRVSELLTRRFFIRIDRFAKPLYDHLEQLTGITYEQAQDRAIKDRPWRLQDEPLPGLAGLSPRQILIDYGADLRRRYGEDILARMLVSRAKKFARDCVAHEFHHVLYIATDCRLFVECQHMDLVYELEREGVEYEGGKTESGLEGYPATKVDLDHPESIQGIVDDIIIRFRKDP